MGDNALHELTAAYALDALDADDERAYEEHLAHCDSCRDELAGLSGTAGALALAAGPAVPPADLRTRILEAAHAERPNVVPLRPRWTNAVAAVAAVAACLALGLGVWNVVLQHRLDRAQVALRSVPLNGATGSVVVGGNGRGALVLTGLEAAPNGKTYEAWVIADGKAHPAGTFRGGDKTVVVRLQHAVPDGGIVGVTVEPAGGSAAPSGNPFITSAPV